MISHKIYLGIAGKKGLGVFAKSAIKKGELLEVSPVIVLNNKDSKKIIKTALYDYYFIWGDKEKETAIGLGYSSLYNHSYRPNAEYEGDYKQTCLIYRALKNIKKGEEICVNYHCDPDSKKRVWFKLKK